MSPDVPKIVSNTKFTAGEKITKIDQNYVDNICNNWAPEILYLSKFLSIYLRLLFNKDFAKSQYKILKIKYRFV